jgi:hypothetical protein
MEGRKLPTMNEPVFPKPEGPYQQPLQTQPADGGDGVPKPVPVPPGADGFAQETLITLTKSATGDIITDISITDPTAVSVVLPGQSDSVLLSPNAAGWQWNADTLASDNHIWTFFIPRRSVNVAGIGFYTTGGALGGQTIDVGIYQIGGATRLRRSGVVAAPGLLANTWNRINLTAPLLLTAGTICRIGIFQDNTANLALGLLKANFGTNAYMRQLGDTIANWLQGVGPGGQVSLPDPLVGTGPDQLGPALLLYPA